MTLPFTQKQLAEEVRRILVAVSKTHPWVSETIVPPGQKDWTRATVAAGLAYGDLLTGVGVVKVAAAVAVRQLPGLTSAISAAAGTTIAAPARFAEGDGTGTYPADTFPPWYGRRAAVQSDTIQQPPSFPWQMAAIYSAYVKNTARPASHSLPYRKARDPELVSASIPLSAGRAALAETAKTFERNPLSVWEGSDGALGFTAAATRFTALDSARDRVQPLLDHLPSFAVRGTVAPTFAADDGLAACLCLVMSAPGSDDGPHGTHYAKAATLTAASLRLRLALDDLIDAKRCLCMLGFRPAPIERPDLGNMAAGRLPVLVDPCSWIGVAGILAFVLARGKAAGVLVVNPRSTSDNGLEVFTCDDIEPASPVIVLAAPYSDTSGYALVSIEDTDRGSGGAHHRFHVPWSQIEPFTRPKLQRDFGSLTSELPAKVTRHCLGINTDFIRQNSTDPALRYACATTKAIATVQRGETDDDDWFLQAIPRVQSGLPPPRKPIDCDGPLRAGKALEPWRGPDNSAFPSHTGAADRRSHWLLKRHNHTEAPNFTPYA